MRICGDVWQQCGSHRWQPPAQSPSVVAQAGLQAQTPVTGNSLWQFPLAIPSAALSFREPLKMVGMAFLYKYHGETSSCRSQACSVPPNSRIHLNLLIRCKAVEGGKLLGEFFVWVCLWGFFPPKGE